MDLINEILFLMNNINFKFFFIEKLIYLFNLNKLMFFFNFDKLIYF